MAPINPISKNKISVPKPVKSFKQIGGQTIDTNFGAEPARRAESNLQQQKNEAQANIPSPVYQTLSSTDSNYSDTSFSLETKSAFETMTGISNKIPEIVAVTDFIPCYTDTGELNDFGKFLQIKQDATLVSTVDAIKTLNSKISKDEEAKATLALYKNNLLEFCNNFGGDIDWLLAGIQDAKDSLNPLRVMSSDVVNSFIKNNPQFDGLQPATIESIVGVNPQELSWTYTKSWIQSCLSLKDTLNYGACASINDSLFLDGDDNNWKNDQETQNGYSLVKPKNASKSVTDQNKIKFADNQLQLPAFFNTTYEVYSNSNFNELKDRFSKIFEKSSQDYTSIFNIPLSDFFADDDKKKQKSIAQLSYAITRELRYSSEIRKIPSDIINTYGYPSANLSSTNNGSFLNYIVGNCGKDITEIAMAPEGAGYSLISLSQFISADDNKNEILTFEKSYVNDNVGSGSLKRDGSILTPGTVYLIDQALNFSIDKNFDLVNVTNFKTKLDKARLGIKKILKDGDDSGLLFNLKITPRSFEHLINGNVNDVSIETALKNPLLLLRTIEQRIVNKYLPRQSPPPAFARQGSYNTSAATDYSLLLISQGLDGHPELLSLLYMYVIGNVNAKVAQKQGGSNSSNSSAAIQNSRAAIQDIANGIERLENELGKKTTSNPQNKFELTHRSVQSIKDAVVNSNLLALNSIADLICDMISFFEKDNQQYVDPNPFKTESNLSKSYYRGIQREVIITCIFYLCCLMLHEVNPEKITGFNQSQASLLNVRIEKKGKGSLSGQKKTANGAPEKNEYFYDKLIIEVEKQIHSEIVRTTETCMTFLCFLEFLHAKMAAFVSSLENYSNKITTDVNYIKQILQELDGDSGKVAVKLTELMTIRQLSLLKSKLAGLRTRLSDDYKSELRNVVPYFVSLKKEKDLELLLPIEDFSMVSWNYLLKDYFSKQEFGQTIARNKKILSVGIPARLYQTLHRPVQADSARRINPPEIVKIKVYLNDYLRPTLIHKPQEFLFDLNFFNIKTLNYYVDQSLIESHTYDEVARTNFASGYVKQFGFFNVRNNKQNQAIAENAYDFYNNVSQTSYGTVFNGGGEAKEVAEEVIENHIASFALEEYLKFVSGRAFDESIFYRTKNIEKFNVNSLLMTPSTMGEAEYAKNGLFVGHNKIIASLIQPKKFDRVFHLAIDPDDFEVDQVETNNLKNLLGSDILSYYEGLGTIKKNDNDAYLRQTAQNDEIEIYGFSVEVEAFI